MFVNPFKKKINKHQIIRRRSDGKLFDVLSTDFQSGNYHAKEVEAIFSEWLIFTTYFFHKKDGERWVWSNTDEFKFVNPKYTGRTSKLMNVLDN